MTYNTTIHTYIQCSVTKVEGAALHIRIHALMAIPEKVSVHDNALKRLKCMSVCTLIAPDLCFTMGINSPAKITPNDTHQQQPMDEKYASQKCIKVPKNAYA